MPMVLEVGAFEAKTHLSKLLDRVQKGDRVVITHRGKPVAVMVAPGELERGHVADVIRRIREVRERTKSRPGSVGSLRSDGRRR
jgi:prevent-host-death family protein